MGGCTACVYGGAQHVLYGGYITCVYGSAQHVCMGHAQHVCMGTSQHVCMQVYTACVYGDAQHVCMGTYIAWQLMQVRGSLVGVVYLLLPHAFWGWNSRCPVRFDARYLYLLNHFQECSLFS